ncbi:TPA: hypothetical protein ACKP4S_000361 [Stenotrophomonas maltophilia]|jgi:hypothetical protein|uniref:hypothetical protein n=1 Tax=Stenotrophomonas sp. SMYL86 TaxID=3076044 RepID=UPI0013128096|nr:hypothetical protein [Stenotrophomonas sp. SMYL86]
MSRSAFSFTPRARDNGAIRQRMHETTQARVHYDCEHAGDAAPGGLTVDEDAHYCSVSRSQFDSNIADYGVEPRNFMGKKLYDQAALYSAIYCSKQ